MAQRITKADVERLKQKLDQLNSSLDNSDRGILLGLFTLAEVAIEKAPQTDAGGAGVPVGFRFEPQPANAQPSLAEGFEGVFRAGDPAIFEPGGAPEAGGDGQVSIGEHCVTWSAQPE